MQEEEPIAYPVGSIANESKPFLTTTDFDSLVYEFFPSEYETIFTLGDETGALYTSVVIDRETVCEFKTDCELEFDVLIRSKDGAYTQPVTVKVVIEDINDNSPLFPKQTYTLEISEGSHKHSAFSIDPAVDIDFGINNSIQSYHLEADSDNAGIFELNVTKNRLTFSLKLVLMKILDREVKESYSLKVVAKDGGNPANTGAMAIYVKVMDTNDNPPIFSQPVYNITVNESTPIHNTILKLSADDADIGENAQLSFRISEVQEDKDTISELFYIEPTGEIKVKSDLTPMAGQFYKIIVEVVDHGSEPQSSEAEVHVNIHDSGNNAPEVTVSLGPGNRGFVNISESSPTGTFVASVNVVDTDSGLNGEVTCEVDNQHFGIESFGGKRYKVVVRSLLDREVKETHNVVVTCSDHGTPQMSGYFAFRVTLDDKNDNKPVFEKSLYTAKLKENLEEDKIIVQVSATDADIGNNALIRYTLHSDALNKFIVDRDSGVVTAVSPFDREKDSFVTFRVLAINDGKTPLTGTATIIVTIEDENDFDPEFNNSVHGFKVFENQPTGTDIAMLEAYDLDEGVNAEFDFSIDPEYLDKVPFIVFSKGLLKANKMLDREETSRYDFVVIVKDHGVTPRSSSAHVTVIVEDVNDNPPILNFPKPSNYTVTLLYPGFQDKHVAQIDAYDIDEGVNKDLEYSIKSGNDMGIFGINKDSGEVYFDSVVDIGSDLDITLQINVSDKGDPKLSTVRDLKVELKYTNATFVGQGPEDSSKYIIISVVVVIVTLIISGGIIALILFLRTLDRKRKNKKEDTNDSDFGFAGATSHSTILSTDSLSPSAADPSRELIKKKEVSFILNSSDSQEYLQQKPETSSTSLPGKSSLRYQPSFTPSVPDRTSDLATTMYDSFERLTPITLDSRELQEKANEQLHTIKQQQVLLQNRAKQWIQQQQQQQFGPVHHDDHHSETSAETIGSDSGRGGSEEDDVTSSPSADDPKTFDISSPESQRYYLSQTNRYPDTQNMINQSSYTKQPWSRKPHLAQRDLKHSHHSNRHNNFLHPDSVPNSYSSYNSNSWGQPYFSVAGPMDYTGDSAMHSFFDKTPVGISRDDDDNYSTTTSGSYTIYSEEIL